MQIDSVNANGIIVSISDVTLEGQVTFDFIRATADLMEIEDIEAKAQSIVQSIVASALNTILSVNSKADLSVTFAPFNTETFTFDVEGNPQVITAINAASAALARFNVTGEVGSDFGVTLLAGLMSYFTVSDKIQAVVGTINAEGITTAVSVATSATFAATFVLMMIKATIGDYAGVKLSEMGGKTLEELSKIIN